MPHLGRIEELSVATTSRNWLIRAIGVHLRVQKVSQLVMPLRKHEIDALRIAIISSKALRLERISIDVGFRLVGGCECLFCLK